MDLLELLKETLDGKLVRIQADSSQNTNFFNCFDQSLNCYMAVALDADQKPKKDDEKVPIPLDALGIVADVKNENRAQTTVNVLFGQHMVQLSMIEIELMNEGDT